PTIGHGLVIISRPGDHVDMRVEKTHSLNQLQIQGDALSHGHAILLMKGAHLSCISDCWHCLHYRSQLSQGVPSPSDRAASWSFPAMYSRARSKLLCLNA